MKPVWNICQPDPKVVREVSTALGNDPLTALLLVNRGIRSPKAARAFLNPTLAQLQPPQNLRDLKRAAERISAAIQGREKILIFGDYDVDGVTATALLLEFLRDIGTNVGFYIPHRRDEGYGLQPTHIDEVAVPGGYRLLITVDCGIGSHAAIKAALAQGIDVIVTDHHLPSEALPDALAVVNPKRHDCQAGLDHLSGVGMAFYLLIQLRACLRQDGFWEKRGEPDLRNGSDLVALGTIADMVPLIRENRALTRTGLYYLSTAKRPGLAALMDISRVKPAHIDAEDVAYRLAPRLNAAGRMAHAELAVELLTTTDRRHANRLAQRLDALNRQRQAIESEMVDAIIKQLEHEPRHRKQSAVLLKGSNWHEGIIGIAATRLVQRLAKPAVLVNQDGDQLRGSARSIPGLDIFTALKACADLLSAYGGHAMAAGLRLKASDWDTFRHRLSEQIQAALAQTTFQPHLAIDMELTLEDITPNLLELLERLRPFGQAVPEPLFMARDIVVVDSRLLGGRHRRMNLSSENNSGSRPVGAIQFNLAPGDRSTPQSFDKIAFHVRRDFWNGKGMQLRVVATEP